MYRLVKHSAHHLKLLPDWWATVVLGLAGGWLANRLNCPLPYTIGPLVALALGRCLTGWSIPGVPHGRQIGQFVVGLGVGMYVDQQVIGQLLAHSLLLVMIAMATLLASFVPITLLRATGEDRATAFFSSMPGGSAEMVNLAQRNGARVDAVATAQTLRLTLVVICAPVLVGFLVPAGNEVIAPLAVNWCWLSLLIPLGLLAGWFWQRMHQPNPWLLGPLLVSAGVSLTSHVQVGFPPQINHLAQVLIGISLGRLISRDFFIRSRGFILSSLLGTVCLILVAVVMAVAASWLCPLQVSTLMLGIMPGGVAEMSLTARGLNLAAPMVVAMQLMRLFTVLFCAEPLFRCWQRRHEPGYCRSLRLACVRKLTKD